MPRKSTEILSRTRRDEGVALVIVLAFVVLLTGLIVAYFSRTMTDRQLSNSSFNQASADALAKSALDIITSDLKQELVASSTPVTVGNVTIYTNPETLPVRNGSPGKLNPNLAYPIPNLLRTSTTTGTTGLVDHLASVVSSTMPSLNGRSISPARWNQHYLMPRKDLTNNALDSTPTGTNNVLTNTGSFTVPSWVYVTNQGPQVLTSATSTVVGRYAYAIYDEAALLDVNTAGYPNITSTASGTGPYVTSGTLQALYSGKGTLAFADLSVLTGTGNPPLTGSTINSLVGWRNYATLTGASGPAIGTFPSFANLTGGSGPTAAFNFYNYVTSSTNGFLKTSGTVFNGQTDQAFLSRQQLINLMLNGIGTSGGNTMASMQNTLQHLSTFSRAVNAPSWSPPADASALINPAPFPAATGTNTGTNGASYAYRTNAEKGLDQPSPNNMAGPANRDLANVRFITGGTVLHYYDDGSTTPYNVQVGDPLLQRRFSLARIAWLPHDGSTLSGSLAQAVKDCFGLQWGADAYGNPCWMYVHGSRANQTTALAGGGSTTSNTILTLDQVASLGREPDFFELLKAAILAGSLARTPGPDYTHFNNYNNGYGYGSWQSGGPQKGAGGTSFDTVFSHPDTQIIQIGVNIIDQARTDSYPSAIYFQGPNIDDTSVPENGPLNVFYGIKNLPYFNKMNTIYWDIMGAGSYNGFNVWLQPELWNPFQATPVTGSRPTSFCAQVYGMVKLNFTGGCVAFAPAASSWDFDSLSNPAESSLYFKDPLTSGSYVSTFANPMLLSATSQDTSVAVTTPINIAPPPGTAKSHTQSQSPSNVTFTYTGTSSWNQFMGFHAGYAPFAIIPFNGAYSGQSSTGTASDTSHVWVVDNNQTYYSGTTHNDNNYIPHLTPQAPPAKGITFCLKYWDGSRWLPYTYISRDITANGATFYPNNLGDANDNVFGVGSAGGSPYMHTDPLTDRFTGSTTDGSHYHWNTKSTTWQWTGPGFGVGQYNAPQPCPGAFYYDYNAGGSAFSTNGVPNADSSYPQEWVDGGLIGLYYGSWAQNLPLPGGNDAYYCDLDGIVRPGNDCLWNSTNKIDGLSQLKDGYSTTTGSNTNASGPSNVTHTMGRRPLILNRPFRSVGELGYAYRDLPFKTLDFFTSYSADAALLDVFSVSDQPVVVAGHINPNDSPQAVLAAIFSGGGKQEVDSTYNVSAEANALALRISRAVQPSGTAAIASRADLVTKLGVQMPLGVIAATQSPIYNGFSSSTNAKGDQANKTYIEAPVRALADVTNTRTWNLMIDVIAQTGNFPSNANNLQNFMVQGERRYWLHIAIDRFTGKVVDEQLEPVYE